MISITHLTGMRTRRRLGADRAWLVMGPRAFAGSVAGAAGDVDPQGIVLKEGET